MDFFRDVYPSKVSIIIDHAKALVRVSEDDPRTAEEKVAEMIAGYLEHAFRVCREGTSKVPCLQCLQPGCCEPQACTR